VADAPAPSPTAGSRAGSPRNDGPPPPAAVALPSRRPEPLGSELLDQYLAFIEAPRPAAPTLQALADLQIAHLCTIPFENLDAYLGRPVPIDRAAIARKFFTGRRGGYCFEHNLLFASALVALGYEVELLSCRFVLRQTFVRPPTHLALRVTIDGDPVLADVGFGLQALRGPVHMQAGLVQRQGDHRFCLVEAGDQFVLHTLADRADAEWEGLYVIDPIAVYEADAILANHFVETHPASSVKERLLILRPTEHGRRSIVGSRLSIDEPGRHETREILDTEFGITLPAPIDTLER
jgi:N-hydroxyarylamine O-acetyltransferase